MASPPSAYLYCICIVLYMQIYIAQLPVLHQLEALSGNKGLTWTHSVNLFQSTHSPYPDFWFLSNIGSWHGFVSNGSWLWFPSKQPLTDLISSVGCAASVLLTGALFLVCVFESSCMTTPLVVYICSGKSSFNHNKACLFQTHHFLTARSWIEDMIQKIRLLWIRVGRVSTVNCTCGKQSHHRLQVLRKSNLSPLHR